MTGCSQFIWEAMYKSFAYNMHNTVCNYACMYSICSYFTVGQCVYMATTKGEPGDGFQFMKDLFLKVYHHVS